MNLTNLKNLKISDLCVPLVGQGRVSPHWPGPVPGDLTMVSVYNPPSATIRAQIRGGGGCLFLTRLVNHKSHTFEELIEIQIVKCLSGCCKILVFRYFSILALDMASPYKILF